MKQYFEGLYFKHQNGRDTLCLIPGRSEEHAFIQVITDGASYNVDFPLAAYKKGDRGLSIGDNHFSTSGVTLAIETEQLALSGTVRYGAITPLRYDIMGPFAHLPMQCRHSVVSMHHPLYGALNLEGSTISFDGGIGYIEGDRGRSFPKFYTWIHCNDFPEPCSITLALAHIPFGPLTFTGCTCAVWHGGREYRLATYRGACIRACTDRHIQLTQGDYSLTADMGLGTGNRLLAPQNGVMSRQIHESASVGGRFVFRKGDVCLFDYASDHASFEHVLG